MIIKVNSPWFFSLTSLFLFPRGNCSEIVLVFMSIFLNHMLLLLFFLYKM